MNIIEQFSKKQTEIVGLFNEQLYKVWPSDSNWTLEVFKSKQQFSLAADTVVSFTDVLCGRVGYLSQVDGEFKSNFESALEKAKADYLAQLDGEDDEDGELLWMDNCSILFKFSFEYFNDYGYRKNCFAINLRIVFDQPTKIVERLVVLSEDRGLDVVVEDALDMVETFFCGQRRNYVYVQVPAKNNRIKVNLYKLDNKVPVYNSSFEYNFGSTRGVTSEIWTHLTGKEGYFYNGMDNIYLYELYNK